jgi:murein DD-endopeptidase MepM/ murein hydrolase activator NlpD
MHYRPDLQLVRSQDLKSIGIKTAQTGLTTEEKVTLRKRYIAYKHTALMVTKSTNTVEAISNTDVLVVVGDVEDIEVAVIPRGVCECESYRLYYGKNVTCEFRKKVMTISKELWPSNYKEMANGLMAVMYRETGGSLASNQIEGKPNSYKIAKDKMTKAMFEKTDNKGKPSSRAVGLVQFTQNSLVSMKEFEGGKGYDILHELKLSYARMTEVDQLSKVKKYMQSVKSLPKVPEDIYVAVFAPDYLGKNKDTVMYKKGTNDYDSNSSLDKDNNGIQVKELLGAFHTSLTGGLGGSVYTCKNSEKKESEGDCPEDKCIHYADVVDNPRINDQSGNKNHNRWKNEQRTRANGTKYFHSGADILASVGTDVKSLLCGKVVHVRSDLPQNDYEKGYESASSYGNTITIESKDNEDKIIYIYYAHMSEISVDVNQIIKHNEVIGKSGSTGNAMHVDEKFRHIHIEAGTAYNIYDNNIKCKLFSDLNPENYMKTKFDKQGNVIE